jgi:hypothetical protein
MENPIVYVTAQGVKKSRIHHKSLTIARKWKHNRMLGVDSVDSFQLLPLSFGSQIYSLTTLAYFFSLKFCALIFLNTTFHRYLLMIKLFWHLQLTLYSFTLDHTIMNCRTGISNMVLRPWNYILAVTVKSEDWLKFFEWLVTRKNNKTKQIKKKPFISLMTLSSWFPVLIELAYDFFLTSFYN